jgi:hypothetical protein
MAAKTCQEVLDGDKQNLTGVTGNVVPTNPEPTSDSKLSLNDKVNEFFDIFNDTSKAIQKSATDLYMYDCSDHLYDWITDLCPWLKTGLKAVDSAKKFMNSLSSGVKLKDFMATNTVTKAICNAIATFYGTLIGWLEICTKAAFVLFEKIDAARKKLEKAMKRITNATLACLLDIYDAIDKYLQNTIELSLAVDWNGLIKFMTKCPCVSRFIAYITGCDKDDDGNSISDNPTEIVNCIKEKFSFLDGATLATGLSKLMDKYIRQYLVLFFDFIKFGIDFLFSMIIAPFRWLIKQYADFLRKKWDVTAMIEGCKEAHLDCLFVYTIEYDGDRQYYGMSILDMITTLKRMIPCLEYGCPGLSDKIRNKVKKLNEDLRLTDEFWNRAFEADLYMCCIDADAERAYTFKQLRDMWDSLWDRLVSKTQKAAVVVDENRKSVTLGSFGAAIDEARREAGVKPKDPYASYDDPYKQAATFATGMDLENNIINGDEYVSSNDEDILIKVAGSIVQGMKNGDDYYNEKWYQYLRFKAVKEFSDGGMDKLQKYSDELTESYKRAPVRSAYLPGPRRRLPLEIDTDERPPNYKPENDYNQQRVEVLLATTWEPSGKTESLSDYYARMYAKAV